MNLLPPLRLTGATILRDGEMQRRSIALAEGRITAGPLPEVDLGGYLVLPGIVDLGGDGFDRQLAARPEAPPSPLRALAAADRAAAAQGITTAFLRQHWSWEGGPRGPEAALAMLSALEDHRPRALTDLRAAIACETHLVGTGPALLEAAARHRIGYVVFRHTLAEALEMRRTDPAGFALQAHRAGRSPEAHLAALEAAIAGIGAVPRHLCRLAEGFDALGTVYASHADPDGETRERFSMIGARLAEQPLTRRAAAAAKAMMSPVILSAAELLREGAPPLPSARPCAAPGRARVADLLAGGLCDVLISDSDAAALVPAVFALVDRGVMSLPRAWALISTNAAEVMRLPDRGLLAPGKRADLTIVNAATQRVEATIAGGRLTHLSGAAARQFRSQPETARLAAE